MSESEPPAVWWSPSLNTVITRGDHDHVYIDEHFALPADAVRLVPDTDPDSVVGGLADGAIRYCDWPGCMDRVDTINGPVANGWRQTRRLLLCPDHSVREHWADYFKTEDGADVAGVWCTCGHRWAERPVNLNVLRAWWQQHVGTLGTEPAGDTTPDRLAWIDTAAETAAAERQARYQETACARRPAATSGDPAQPDLAYARSEVDKWLDDGDPYCILPTRTEHIPALLARLDELEGTR